MVLLEVTVTQHVDIVLHALASVLVCQKVDLPIIMSLSEYTA
jgi:hypothetical protein